MGNYDLPYGQPVEYNGNYKEDPEHPLYIQQISVDMELKEGGIPCILNKNKQLGNGKYIIDTAQQADCGNVINLTLTKYDLELMYKNYNIY